MHDKQRADEKSLVLLDLDGTLLDTPRAIVEQMSLAVDAVTGALPDRQRVHDLVGAPLEHMAGTLSDSAPDSPTARAITLDYQARYRELIVPKAEELVFPGVRDGLDQLGEAGLVLAIVTSKVHDSAEAILTAAGIRDYFRVLVGADDVAHPKPHRDSADVALRAVGRTDIGRYGAVIGDTGSDIGLGKAISAFTIGVTYGVSTTARILASQPDALAHTFGDATNAVLTRIGSESSS